MNSPTTKCRKRPAIQALEESGPTPAFLVGNDPENWFGWLDDLDEIADAIDAGYLEVAQQKIEEAEAAIYPSWNFYRREAQLAPFEAVVNDLTLEVEMIQDGWVDPKDVGITSADFFEFGGSHPHYPRSVLYERDAY